MDYRSALIALVTAYRERVSRSEARIANLIGSDGRFFDRIRNGSTCSVDTLNRALAWFSANWPDGVAWPEGVERPDVRSEAA